MNLVSVAASSVVKIFLTMAIGVIAEKLGILTKAVSDATAQVLVKIIIPLMIASSFFREYDPALLKGMGISVLLSLAYYAIGIGLGFVLVKKGSSDLEVERTSILYQNIGFIGVPIASMIFGADGIIYMACHLAVFQPCYFTHGVLVFSGKLDKKNFLQALKSPCIIAALIGIIIFITGLPIPELIKWPISTVGSCATPIGMLLAGGIIGRSKLGPVLKNKRTYLISFVKLIILPLIIALICKICGLSETLGSCAIICAACPVASFNTLYADIYNKDSAYASGLFGLTTIASMFTIPLMVILYGLI